MNIFEICIRVTGVLYFVDNQQQNETSDICGVFQLYFYKNLFEPIKKGKIINDNKLAINIVLTLLNEIFSTSDKENEQVIEQFAEEYEIRIGQKLDSVQGLTIPIY